MRRLIDDKGWGSSACTTPSSSPRGSPATSSSSGWAATTSRGIPTTRTTPSGRPERDHPITRGVRPFLCTDEWYFKIRFQPDDPRVTPILTAKGLAGHDKKTYTEPQVVAWATERRTAAGRSASPAPTSTRTGGSPNSAPWSSTPSPGRPSWTSPPRGSSARSPRRNWPRTSTRRASPRAGDPSRARRIPAQQDPARASGRLGPKRRRAGRSPVGGDPLADVRGPRFVGRGTPGTQGTGPRRQDRRGRCVSADHLGHDAGADRLAPLPQGEPAPGHKCGVRVTSDRSCRWPACSRACRIGGRPCRPRGSGGLPAVARAGVFLARRDGREGHERQREVSDHGDCPGWAATARRDRGRRVRGEAHHAQGTRRPRGRGGQPRAVVRRGLRRLLHRGDEGGRGRPEAPGPAGCGRHRDGRHRPPFRGRLGLEVALRVDLPGLDRADAERLVEAAHQICPYSNATRNNIDVQLSVA